MSVMTILIVLRQVVLGKLTILESFQARAADRRLHLELKTSPRCILNV